MNEELYEARNSAYCYKGTNVLINLLNNVLHPFREGNGRTIREFIRKLAYKNGYLLDLQKVEPSEVYDAFLKSVIDTTDLENVIDKCRIKTFYTVSVKYL